MKVAPFFTPLALAMIPVSCDRPKPTAAPTVAASAPATLVESTRWPHVGSDLRPDGKVTWGALANGLRFALLPNDEPPGRLSLRLYIEAGSLHESDEQRGLAHFLEHMAFNGTKNFAAGEMVAYFQRLGMGFGADTNAHTSFRETVYKLELPPGAEGKSPDDKTLRDGLQLLRDMADSMLLNQAEIDKERGIILSEKLSRDTIDFRIFKEGLEFQLPDHKISKRLPIGVEEVITQASREQFLELYRKFYTPDRMIFVAVGALDPQALARHITDSLGGLEKRERMADPDFGSVTIGRGVATKPHLEKEAGYATVSFSVTLRHQPRLDTAEERLNDLKRELATRMVGRRFEILAKQKDAPLLQAQVELTPFLRLIDVAQIEITAQPNRWHDAVALGARELRRAMDFGFTKSELAEASAGVLAEAESAARSADTRKSRDLANLLVQTLAAEKVFTHPAQELPRIKDNLARITADDCHQSFKSGFGSKDLAVFAAGNLLPPANGETLEAALKRGMSEKVEAPQEASEANFAYTDFGVAGQVSSRQEVDDLGITQIVFKNNVRLNLKPTPFKKDEILVQASFGAGKLALPVEKPGLELFAEHTFELGGLVKHSVDDLRRILAGKTVTTQFQIGEDAFVLSGKTTPSDLTTQLQLLCAFLTAPGWREESDRIFREQVPTIYSEIEHTLEGQIEARLEPYLHGGDHRFAFPAKEHVLARTPEEARGWLELALQKAPLEVALVGDIDIEAAIKAASTTFGALADRDEGGLPKPGALNFPPAGRKDFTYESKIARALVAVHFPTTDRADIAKTRRLQVLASVFSDRLREKIREELGESYSPRATATASDVFPGYGYLFAHILVGPSQANKVSSAVREIAAALSADGVQPDEVDRALKPLLNAIEEQRRNNVYWLTTVCGICQRDPRRLDWARTLISDFKSVTKPDLDAVAKEYLAPPAVREVRLIPLAANDPTQPPSPAPNTE
ncbi:MAG: M16 family metallopeptidase [Verrucomicrobiales bacterium]